jgi:hypothetical protein
LLAKVLIESLEHLSFFLRCQVGEGSQAERFMLRACGDLDFPLQLI